MDESDVTPYLGSIGGTYALLCGTKFTLSFFLLHQDINLLVEVKDCMKEREGEEGEVMGGATWIK